MRLSGEWVAGDDSRQIGDLYAWGEWEPESDVIRRLDRPGGESQSPRYLWRPYYVPRNSYRGVHSTDPFIFGERFLYSHCGQASKRGLRNLGQGSVIAFGSGRVIDHVPRWMLDTVLVVRDFKDYTAADARRALRNWVPATFLDVTVGPLTDNSGEAPTSGTCAAPPARLRIYRGATPNDPIHGTFSFVPAIPAGRNSGFPRPLVDLAGDYFNARNVRAPKGQSRSRRPDELRNLWKRLVKQVRDAGLVLGTRADLPARRGGYRPRPGSRSSADQPRLATRRGR